MLKTRSYIPCRRILPIELGSSFLRLRRVSGGSLFKKTERKFFKKKREKWEIHTLPEEIVHDEATCLGLDNRTRRHSGVVEKSCRLPTGQPPSGLPGGLPEVGRLLRWPDARRHAAEGGGGPTGAAGRADRCSRAPVGHLRAPDEPVPQRDDPDRL